MKLAVLGYFYAKTGPFANGQKTWCLVKGERDNAEPPRDSDWWRGESEDKKAWIYTKVEIPDDASLGEIIDELRDTADLKFAELYPGRVVG